MLLGGGSIELINVTRIKFGAAPRRAVPNGVIGRCTIASFIGNPCTKRVPVLDPLLHFFLKVVVSIKL